MMNSRERIITMRHKTPIQYWLVFFFIFLAPSVLQGADHRLPLTPADHEGPFYPVTRQADEDNNLRQVIGRQETAAGPKLDLSGIVVSSEGKPYKGIIIEIWQTDTQGRYRHPGDRSSGQRDDNFQYWGKATTDQDGFFSFATLLPGAYNPRPAHIHYKIWRGTDLLLTSQIYFRKPAEKKEPRGPASRKDLLTTDLQPTESGDFQAFFKIVI